MENEKTSDKRKICKVPRWQSCISCKRIKMKMMANFLSEIGEIRNRNARSWKYWKKKAIPPGILGSVPSAVCESPRVAAVTQGTRYKDRPIDQHNRTQHLKIDAHTEGQLIFNPRAKGIQWQKNKTKWYCTCRTPIWKTMNLDSYLSPYPSSQHGI